MNLKEALRLSSPKTAKKSNNCRDRSPLPPPSLRDYKRRPSGSPPPPYRDRRHSRRDDSGYDGRRGGYGPPDRSLFKDISLLLAYLIVVEDQIAFLTLQYLLGMIDLDMRMTVRWEEGMVTVIKRPPGRFMGHYQDWEGGRGSYGDASNRGSTQRLKDKYHLTNLHRKEE